MSFVALIVEDKEFEASNYKSALRLIAEHVYVAYNLKDAMKFVATLPQLNIVTLDLHMPDCSLTEVLGSVGKIHAAHPHCAVIILTGDDSPEIKRLSIESGADNFAMKHDACTVALLLQIVLSAMTKKCSDKPDIMKRLDELVMKLAQGKV